MIFTGTCTCIQNKKRSFKNIKHAWPFLQIYPKYTNTHRKTYSFIPDILTRCLVSGVDQGSVVGAGWCRPTLPLFYPDPFHLLKSLQVVLWGPMDALLISCYKNYTSLTSCKNTPLTGCNIYVQHSFNRL